MSQINPYKKYAVEMIGTLVLVLTGCGSAVLAGNTIGNVGIAFSFGLAVLTMAYAIGSISGCHINPAVSIAMLVAGKISARDAAMYIIAQCTGATIGSGALYIIASGNPAYSLAANGLGQNQYSTYSMLSAFTLELLLTFIFLLVILGSTSEAAPKGFAGISIGLSLVLIHLVAIPVTGTSVNPARSLGPALIVGGTALNQLWLFWAAPVIGAILAAFAWKILK